MTVLFLILIILASVILGFIILVQSPKGGGLAGNVGGLSNQFMGVKQTTDLLEKGTWVFAIIVALLCLFSAAFIPQASGGKSNSIIDELNTKPAVTAPAQTPAAPGNQQLVPAPAAQDSTVKPGN
ncbi:preprotein translocase subunit SecG [Flavihumibacter sp. CACIAM 22H1]|uniref:preprotein translocase subunit SecG n=1 Tax=Flavihumibacter sp. CACIAM 22H1 TaxID=1812911 RepID=UPI0007A8584D|nr:preprotein translocase subunit SecG [Flavihumibacter sp. CACIAM 22H1]KYP14482.1 MAG: preprotein translocase subunit SecG [Flavihumibacter sp. CACIAM 22H1]